MKKAFVFDFDDTLAVTDAKVRVLVGGEVVKKLTPSEFNEYELQSDEEFGFEEFRCPDILMNGQPTFLIHLAKEVNDECHSVYVLTARSDEVADAIHKFLLQFGINAKTVFCVGGTQSTISENKRRVLLTLMESYDKVYFYDDDDRNVAVATDLGVKAQKVEK